MENEDIIDKKKLVKFLKDIHFPITNVDKQIESMKKLGCHYFKMQIDYITMTIDLRK